MPVPRLAPATLKAVKENAKDTGVLLPKVRSHVMAKAAIPDLERDQTILHPSEMSKTKWCPRKDWYRVTDPEPEKISTNFRRENIYMEGHLIHKRWQTWLAEMGMLWGRWNCLLCDAKWVSLSDPLKPCITPGCPANFEQVTYKEYPFRLPEYLLGGSTDGVVVWWEDDEMHVILIEIKSLNIHTLRFEGSKMSSLFYALQSGEIDLDQLWLSIKRPMPSHLKQGMLYLHMARESGHDLLSKVEGILYIYECKWNQDAKEFFVKYNPEQVREKLELARYVRRSIEVGTEVDRPSWTTDENDPECKDCTYRSRCWELTSDTTKGRKAPTVRKSSAAKRKRALTT